MDYKNTVNLPRTDFPMKADLVTREPRRLEQWQQAGLYGRIQAARAGAERFVLHDGPPFANGDVHIGTALNKILKDVIIKYHTLRGRQVPYVPGWDCHGLPIEFKVSQELRQAGNTAADAATIRTACEAYALKYLDIQRTQFKRLGVIADWDNPYVTLRREYEADELRLFADIVAKGFVYRGKKPVWWSIPCRTALAEAEVEYADHVSQSIYVKFPVVGQARTSLVIWTTTPWTLPANLAVAYNSNFTYAQVQCGEEAFIVSSVLLPTVAQKCGWDGYQIVRTLRGNDLAALEYEHPFCVRRGRLFAGDEFVENSTGTGFVHIAPGHGLEDYGLGLRQGLPIYSPVDDEGCLAYTSDLPREQQMPAELIGRSILEKHGKSDANEGVLHLLRVRDVLLKQENYHHSYPHCWRSKTPVIFRAMDQWFIRIDHPLPAGTGAVPGQTFRDFALAAIGQVQWIPEWGRNRIESAVKSRPDWCISRQRAWGVPIPAFYDGAGEPILDARVVRRTADLVEKHGSNIWFEKPAAELWTLVRPPDWSGPEAAAKATDTLDVWIDSGSSSRAVTARRPELRGAKVPFQADMYLEGSDQHRGWFQSSLLLSLAGQGAPPYRTVLTHGFMVDTSREKVSKSKGAMAITAFVDRFGADVVRLWAASQDFRGDIMITLDEKKMGWEMRMEKIGESYRLIRNALRYQLSNLYDFDPAKDAVPEPALTGLDRWILARFAQLEREVAPAYDAYEFHAVYQKISQFAAVELSAIYHDAVKDRLYTDPAGSPRRRSTQTALHRLVTGLCQMLSPILAFTADEAWEFIPDRRESVHLSLWQPGAFVRSEAEQSAWDRLFEIRERVLPELEKERQAKTIGKALDARVILTGSNPMLVDGQAHLEALRELVNVSQLEVHPATGGDDLAVTVAKARGRKCERCWHWEEDVGAATAHPTLCGRCVQAVG